MLDQATLSLLESGSALLVALVSADGEPIAGRAWGLRVVETGTEHPLVRVLLSDHDAAVARVGVGSTIAITGADVSTFRSRQVKGVVRAVEAPTAQDAAMAATYTAAYLGAISRGDATERSLMARMEPAAVVAVTVAVDAAFDQTPGPDAGSELPPAGANA